MIRREVFVTNSFGETQRHGEKFVQRILLDQGISLSKSAYVIALYGDLGSGKTTFVQGLAKGLGIKRRIISPTFIIIRSYNLKSQNSKLKTTTQNLKLFYHIDLYRIENQRGLKELGIEEIIKDAENIVTIEWAEKMERFLPRKRWDIQFEDLDGDKRRITVNIKYQKSNIKNTK